MTERLRRRLFDDIENCGTDLSCGYFIVISHFESVPRKSSSVAPTDSRD
jgi:hypothetical protein